MREILFCEICGRKFHDTGDGTDTPYHYTDGEGNRRYQFCFCQSCRLTICDDCMHEHNCVKPKEENICDHCGQVLPKYDVHWCVKKDELGRLIDKQKMNKIDAIAEYVRSLFAGLHIDPDYDVVTKEIQKILEEK
jgi:hypothetical protein